MAWEAQVQASEWALAWAQAMGGVRSLTQLCTRATRRRPPPTRQQLLTQEVLTVCFHWTRLPLASMVGQARPESCLSPALAVAALATVVLPCGRVRFLRLCSRLLCLLSLLPLVDQGHHALQARAQVQVQAF